MMNQPIVFEISEPPSIETSEFGFTRYLYVIDDVKSSLIVSILEKNLDEALYWGYELYFSGLREDTITILQHMVETMYTPLNPHLSTFLDKKKQEWDNTPTSTIVATFIYNMVYRPYDISHFVTQYCKDTELCKYIAETHLEKSISKSKIYIIAEQKDIKKYITVNHSNPYHLLQHVIKYPVRKNTLAIFDHEHGVYTHSQLQSLYWYRWLYYANASPIWMERISKYGGTINHIKHSIDFTTYENEELFYNKYNLEPDEQCKEIQEMNIGTGTEHQLTWQDFYKNYK